MSGRWPIRLVHNPFFPPAGGGGFATPLAVVEADTVRAAMERARGGHRIGQRESETAEAQKASAVKTFHDSSKTFGRGGGFEPSTSWSRTINPRGIKDLAWAHRIAHRYAMLRVSKGFRAFARRGSQSRVALLCVGWAQKWAQCYHQSAS